MTREMKFRAWDKEKKQWYNDWLWDLGIALDGEMVFYTEDATADDGGTACLVNKGNENNIELMQYTGLKDKNGKEIYEGDIVKASNQNYKGKDIILTDTETKWYYYIIRWNRERAMFEARGINQTVFKYGSGIEEACQVIGNIKDNPELVK